MLARMGPQARRLIDRHVTLAEVPQAYERLIAGDAEGLKTIIRP